MNYPAAVPTPDPSILIIEDDPAVNDLVASQLRRHGYQTEQCFDGRKGLSRALGQHFSLILLDVLLPKLDGFELLNQLRCQRDTPVIMLTACGAEEDRISGFRCGADDYLPKPFNLTELTLRIEAVLRRRPSGADRANAASVRLLRFQNLQLDLSGQVASVGVTELPLTPMEFRLLALLLETPGEVISKPVLYQSLMGRPFSRYDRSIDMHISKLRRKLTNAGFNGEHINTVHGQGYRIQ
ncbi:response regulator transcription factor [Marinobacterium jannaschii]|uniref:response regulator transcription factor n=1 Tax=Marinobacterium jannaschii TaxID=64970 RepID=UPI00068852F5|nr:response regulator transcription factor [Marinobacterium jannaschii]